MEQMHQRGMDKNIRYTTLFLGLVVLIHGIYIYVDCHYYLNGSYSTGHECTSSTQSQGMLESLVGVAVLIGMGLVEPDQNKDSVLNHSNISSELIMVRPSVTIKPRGPSIASSVAAVRA